MAKVREKGEYIRDRENRQVSTATGPTGEEKRKGPDAATWQWKNKNIQGHFGNLPLMGYFSNFTLPTPNFTNFPKTMSDLSPL